MEVQVLRVEPHVYVVRSLFVCIIKIIYGFSDISIGAVRALFRGEPRDVTTNVCVKVLHPMYM